MKGNSAVQEHIASSDTALAINLKVVRNFIKELEEIRILWFKIMLSYGGLSENLCKQTLKQTNK